MKKTYTNWCREFKAKFKIMDPDGFDRKRKESFTTDTYTREDFISRVRSCSCKWHINPFEDEDFMPEF